MEISSKNTPAEMNQKLITGVLYSFIHFPWEHCVVLMQMFYFSEASFFATCTHQRSRSAQASDLMPCLKSSCSQKVITHERQEFVQESSSLVNFEVYLLTLPNRQNMLGFFCLLFLRKNWYSVCAFPLYPVCHYQNYQWCFNYIPWQGEDSTLLHTAGNSSEGLSS